MSYLAFEIGNMYKSKPYCNSCDRSGVLAVIYTGQLDFGASSPGFVYIHPCAVEAAKVINDGNHELNGVVSFEVKALVAFNGKRSRVRF